VPARQPGPPPDPSAHLRAGDLLLVDEAGMLDQDTARALLTIADETGARVAFVGDRHQLPAVGRGGVLDHTTAWAHPTAVVTLERVHRFADPAYAALSLRMRSGEDPGGVFDALVRRGQVVIHASGVERTAALADAAAAGDLVVADTREQVAHLNAAIRDQRPSAASRGESIQTVAGERIGLGDRVATRRNDPDLGVANRQTWTVAGIGEKGSLILHGRGRDREVPPDYATRFIELAYATTVHGAQGETVDHVALGDTTSAAAAYVAMTRGRYSNAAHRVAENLDDARKQWIEVLSRDRADLGPSHARRRAFEAVDLYGPRRSLAGGTPGRIDQGLPGPSAGMLLPRAGLPLPTELAEHIRGKILDDVSSPASATASRCASAHSEPPSVRPPERSAFPTCTRTSCATPRPASPSPAAPTSRSSSRCSGTARRR